VSPELAVNVALVPAHTVVAVAEIVATVAGVTSIVIAADVAVHPEAVVAVTV
jgi:hypothetical protein